MVIWLFQMMQEDKSFHFMMLQGRQHLQHVSHEISVRVLVIVGIGSAVVGKWYYLFKQTTAILSTDE